MCPARGQIVIATQRIQAGMIYARKIVTVTASDRSFQLDIDGEIIAIVPPHHQQRDPPLQGLHHKNPTALTASHVFSCAVGGRYSRGTCSQSP